MKCLLILSWLATHNHAPPQALAITANLYTESKCDPKANNKYQIGLAQWQGKRKTKLLQKQNPLTFHTQLEYLNEELHSYPQYDTFKTLISPEIATIFFCKFYERPKNSHTTCKKRAHLVLTQSWKYQSHAR